MQTTRKIQIIFTTLLLNTYLVFSQLSIQFERTYHDIGARRLGTSILEHPSGDFILTSYSNTGGSWDIVLSRVDATGNVIWEQVLDNAGQRDYRGIRGLIPAQGYPGQYVFQYTTENPGKGDDIRVIRFDDAGTIFATQDFGGAGSDASVEIQPTLDGGYIMTATTNSFGGVANDFYFAKIDQDFNLQWEVPLDFGVTEGPYSIKQTSDGGYAFTGVSFGYGAPYIVGKLNSTGGLVWSNSNLGSPVTSATGYYLLVDGNDIITCGNADGQAFLARYDNNGNLLDYDIYGSATGAENPYGIMKDATGYFLMGYTTSTVFGGEDIIIIRTDLSGNELFTQNFGGIGEDNSWGMIPTSDGGIALYGHTYSFSGDQEAYLLKLQEIAMPATISGIAYNDANGNCIFDAGENLLGNQSICVTPGPYIAQTDNNGFYQIEVPAGTYTVDRIPQANDTWVLSSCQPISYNTTLASSETITNVDFALVAAENTPCQPRLTLSAPSLNPANCPNNQFLESPCPGELYIYCANIYNDVSASVSIPSGSILRFDLDPSMTILAPVSLTGCPFTQLTPNGFNNLFLSLNTPISPGTTCEICAVVAVANGTSGPWVNDISLQVPGQVPNSLVVNGDFEALPAMPPSTFTHSTNYRRACPPYVGNGNLCVMTTPLTGVHNVDNNTPGGSNYLAVDGDNRASNAWCQDLGPLLAGNYDLNFFYRNVINSARGFRGPNIEVRLNGNRVFLSGGVPQTRPPVWRRGNTLVNIPTNLLGPNLLCIRSTVTNDIGGNDFAIDDISFTPVECGGAYFDQLVETDECSCDPNALSVSPAGCGYAGRVPMDQELIYTVKFENIGSGPAHNILITNTIDEDLDITSLRVLGSSHTITHRQFNPDGTLEIRFEGIELPAIDNLPDNRGYVTFALSPKAGLAEGTIIENVSSIVFDNNEAVVTNTVINTYVEEVDPLADYTVSSECSGDYLTAEFTYSEDANGKTFNWDFGVDATPSTSTEANPRVEFSHLGEHEIIFSVGIDGCISESTDTAFVLKPKANLLSNYVVVAKEEIDLFSKVSVEGSVGVDGENGRIHVFSKASVSGTESVVASNNIRIDKKAEVQNVMTNELINKGAVNGTVNSFGSPLVELPDFPYFEASDADMIIKDNDTLYPGTYGMVYVKAGKTLTLMDGEYIVRDFIVSLWGTIKSLGTLDLKIENDFYLGMYSSFDADPSETRIYVKGDYMRTKYKSVLKANVYAPDALALIGDKAVVEGAIIAKDIHVLPEAELIQQTTCWPGFTQTEMLANKTVFFKQESIPFDEEIQKEVSDGINVYPNPTSGMLNISNDYDQLFNVVVRDISGRQVAYQTNQSKFSYIDMSSLGRGLYLIEVVSSAQQRYYKVIKE